MRRSNTGADAGGVGVSEKRRAHGGFKPGDGIFLRQLFNSTCATISSIEVHDDGSAVAVCVNAHDLFGVVPAEKVRIPLTHARSWSGTPRRLSVQEALMD